MHARHYLFVGSPQRRAASSHFRTHLDLIKRCANGQAARRAGGAPDGRTVVGRWDEEVENYLGNGMSLSRSLARSVARNSASLLPTDGRRARSAARASLPMWRGPHPQSTHPSFLLLACKPSAKCQPPSTLLPLRNCGRKEATESQWMVFGLSGKIELTVAFISLSQGALDWKEGRTTIEFMFLNRLLNFGILLY